jgi:hypothetical protein
MAMKKRELNITIGKDGLVNIAVEGVAGPDCIEFTRFLEEELGEVISRERTQDYYQEGERSVLNVEIGEEES